MYETPKMEILELETGDVVTASDLTVNNPDDLEGSGNWGDMFGPVQ